MDIVMKLVPAKLMKYIGKDKNNFDFVSILPTVPDTNKITLKIVVPNNF